MKTVIQITKRECPHCHKIIGNAVIRIGAVINDIMLVDNAELECPREECGRLIGHIEVKPIFIF